jgi:hypothetical protein
MKHFLLKVLHFDIKAQHFKYFITALAEKKKTHDAIECQLMP